MANSLSPTVQFDFSWTLEMTDQKIDRFPRPSDIWAVSRLQCVLVKNSFTENFSTWVNFQITHCEKFDCPLSKISMHYQSLTVIHQLFIWASVGLSKCPMDKMIGLLSHLTIWAIPSLPCVLTENSFTKNFLQINKVSN